MSGNSNTSTFKCVNCCSIVSLNTSSGFLCLDDEVSYSSKTIARNYNYVQVLFTIFGIPPGSVSIPTPMDLSSSYLCPTCANIVNSLIQLYEQLCVLTEVIDNDSELFKCLNQRLEILQFQHVDVEDIKPNITVLSEIEVEEQLRAEALNRQCKIKLYKCDDNRFYELSGTGTGSDHDSDFEPTKAGSTAGIGSISDVEVDADWEIDDDVKVKPLKKRKVLLPVSTDGDGDTDPTPKPKKKRAPRSPAWLRLRRTQCKWCPLTPESKRPVFPSPTALRDHIQSHANEPGVPTCNQGPQCHGRVFAVEYQLREHVASVHEGIRYPCPTCGLTFKDKPGLREHEKFKHSEVPPEVKFVVCEICGKSGLHKKYLTKHMRNVHPPPEALNSFKCTEPGCKYTAPTQQKFRCHSLTHLDTTQRHQFPCHSCSKSYVTRKGLQDHLASVHENSRPFICTAFGSECGNRRYNSKKHLIQHILQVHGKGGLELDQNEAKEIANRPESRTNEPSTLEPGNRMRKWKLIKQRKKRILAPKPKDGLELLDLGIGTKTSHQKETSSKSMFN